MRCHARRLPGRPKSRMPARATPPAAYQVRSDVLAAVRRAAPEETVWTVRTSVAALVPLIVTVGVANAQVGCRVVPPVTAQLRLTVPVKPADGVTLMVVVLEPPLGTVSVAGGAQGERRAAAATRDGCGARVVVAVSAVLDVCGGSSGGDGDLRSLATLDGYQGQGSGTDSGAAAVRQCDGAGGQGETAVEEEVWQQRDRPRR